MEELNLEKPMKALAASSLVVLAGVLISKVFSYIYRIIIARAFGPEIYGLFVLALIIIGIFTSVASLGFSEGLLRWISLDRKNKQLKKSKNLIEFSLRICAVSSVMVLILILLLSDFISSIIFHDPGLSYFLKFLSITIPISVFSGIFLSIIRAHEKIVMYSFLVNVLNNTLKVFIISFLIFLGLGQISIVFSYIAAGLSVLIFAYIGSLKYLKKISHSPQIKNKKITKELRNKFFSYSWPIIFIGLINAVFSWTDSLVIGYFETATSVGVYSVAFLIVALFGIAPDLFMQLFFPLITNQFSKGNTKLINELSKQVNKWIFMINVPLFIIIFLFPGTIINVLFGESFLLAENSLRVLSIGGMVSSLVVSTSNSLFSMKGKSKLILKNLAAISLFNLILNVILVPKYGIFGASIATSISWIILSMIFLFQINKDFSMVPLRRKIIQISMVSVIPTIALFLIKDLVNQSLINLILVGILFSFIYLFLIIITGCLDKNDTLFLKFFKDNLVSKKRKLNN